MSTAEWISMLALVGSVVGIGLLFMQVRQASATAKVSLLLSINRDLNSYADVAGLIEGNPSGNWINALDAQQRERLLDYVSYFEGIQLAMERHLFTVAEIDAFFSNRFFRLANNPDMRDTIFLNSTTYADAFRPIFTLHANLSSYRDQRGLPALYGGASLPLSMNSDC